MGKTSLGWEVLRWRAAPFVASVVLLAFTCVCVPAGRAASASNGEIVRVGVIQDWPPFYLLDKENQPSGFGVDTFNAVSRRAGVTPRYLVYPEFSNLVTAMDRGDIDVIPNFGVLNTRDYLFTSTINTFGVSLFVRSASTGIDSMDDIKGRIGVVETNVGVTLAGNHPHRVFPNIESALFALLADKVDGIIYPSPIVLQVARKAGFERQLRELQPHLREVRRAIAVSPSRPDLRDKLDVAVKAFVGSAEYRQIYTKWNQKPESFWNVAHIVEAGLALLALVVAVLLGWRYRSIQVLNRQLVDQSQLLGIIDGVLISTDQNRKINYVNAGARRLTGWNETELLNEDLLEKLISASCADLARQGLDEVMKGRRWTGELEFNRQDNSRLPVMVSASPVMGPRDRVAGIAAFAADLSGFRLLQTQLLQAQRMEAMGRLAGGVAHDFNNLLTIIKGEVELALETLTAEDSLRANLLSVDRAADTATGLTRRLLAFSRQQALRPRVLDPEQVIRDTGTMLKRLLKENISLKVSAPDETWLLLVDPGQLEQAILNLVVNANDAMPDGGEISILIKNVRHADASGEPRDWVRITVADNGTGMDKDVASHIFEPFFSTKPVGQGTGLGLSIVHGIVHQSGGIVGVESAPGLGTTVSMEFPRSFGEARDDQVRTEELDAAPLGKSILVVEDQPLVRQLISRSLQQDGSEISEASSPVEALEMVDEAIRNNRPFDLLVTDYIMPVMNGGELATRVLEKQPGIPILYLTGYTDGSVTIDGERQHLLFKPFTTRDLRNKVKELLFEF